MLQNVPTIVPVLEKEYRNASRRLEETQVELNDLHPEKLKVGGQWAGLLRSGRDGDDGVRGMPTAWQRRYVRLTCAAPPAWLPAASPLVLLHPTSTPHLAV